MAAVSTHQKHACIRCRGSKVRCLLDTITDHGKCRRCHEANVQCVFESIAPRQRRKRTDIRVAVLERQIEDLEAAIKNSRPPPGTGLGNETTVGHEEDLDIHTSESGCGHHRTAEQQPCMPQGQSETRILDIVKQRATEDELSNCDNETIPGLITSNQLPIEVAVNLLADFVCHVLPEYPILAVTDGDDFISLRKAKPILLLAMVTAASRASDPSLFEKLHSRLITLLAEQIVAQGHRSLELIQATLIMEVWYRPPDDMRRLTFYMWIQIAGTMVQQLGLLPGSDISSPIRTHVLTNREYETLAERRTALAVWLSLSRSEILPKRACWS